MASDLIGVEEVGRALGVSRATVWRLIRSGRLPSVRRAGRRLVSAAALAAAGRRRAGALPAFSKDHPMFRLVGAGRGGGVTPGARNKHAILDR